jgi:hypothetical protein
VCLAAEWVREEGRVDIQGGGADGKVTLILGGKILVVGIELAVDCNSGTYPNLSVIALKTSYISPVSGATTGGSVSVNVLDRSYPGVHWGDAQTIGRARHEEDREADQGSPSTMQCLMKLDGVTTSEGDGGL